MDFNNKELMKLFDYLLLDAKEIIDDENSLFDLDTLRKIRLIFKNRIPNDFELKENQKGVLIKHFIDSNYCFDNATPKFILENKDCIISAIKRNIDSIDFILNIESLDTETKNFIISEAVKQNYILKENSPKLVSSRYIIVKNSLINDVLSADYVYWDAFNEEEKKNLVNIIINNNYILSLESHPFLQTNKDVVLSSVKHDLNSINYASEDMKDDFDIFKVLLLNGYKFTDFYLMKKGLRFLCDDEILDFYFDYFMIFTDKSSEFKSRIKKILKDTIVNVPKIDDFKPFFNMIAESEWETYRKHNINMYENIFGKICSQLRNDKNFEDAIDSLEFLLNIKEILDEKFDFLLNAMKEYHNIFHSKMKNKLDKLQKSQEIIAKSVATYISKSKELYKNKQIKICKQILKPFFKFKKDSVVFNQEIVQEQKKQFISMYRDASIEVHRFIDDLCEKYYDEDYIDLLGDALDYFLFDYDINDLLGGIPYNYDDFIIYEKTTKLINRLNSGYISIDGIEVRKYRSYIKYDDSLKKYVYNGKEFEQDAIDAFYEYKRRLKKFKEIIKEIMFKVKSLKIDDDDYHELMCSIDDYNVFNDQNYEFYSEYSLKILDFEMLYRACIFDDDKFKLNSILNNDSYEKIYELLVTNKLNWLLMFIRDESTNEIKYKFYNNGISLDTITEVIDNMDNIIKLLKQFQFNSLDFENLLDLYQITRYADKMDFAILGADVIKKLYIEDEYTYSDSNEIINMSKDLICHMRKRNYSTVPYIFGNHLNYKYCMYDPLDREILLSGINTDSCFKIDGYDHDFLHYCALNKNGFVIKITDCFDNFVAKASGFRNGNAVYINQLRTIYDSGGIGYKGKYELEQKDIIETFKKACNDIINISQKNPNEKLKIDFVFATKSYALSDENLGVSDELEELIAWGPMDNSSEDWMNYIENTKNLRESVLQNYFSNDFGNFSSLCIASSRGCRKPKCKDIKCDDVPALYERKRNKIIIKQNIDSDLFMKLSQIKAIKAYFDDKEFEEVSIPTNSIIFLGDNWYIVIYNGEIVDECLLDFDNHAKKEYTATLEVIKSLDEDIIIDDVDIFLNKMDLDMKVKCLKRPQ